MVGLILVEGHPTIRSSPIKDVDQRSNSNIFLCLPREILENIAYISYISLHNRFLPYRSPYLPTVYFSKMDMEQTVKDLQAQNAQFQQMLMAVGKGQEDLFSSNQTSST